MSFKIQLTKNGKPSILFENNKYREGYVLKSGEIIWRCLGRSCKATVKTDDKRTIITVSNATHTGPHPVTMRSLSSPQQSRKSPISKNYEENSAATALQPSTSSPQTPKLTAALIVRPSPSCLSLSTTKNSLLPRTSVREPESENCKHSGTQTVTMRTMSSPQPPVRVSPVSTPELVFSSPFTPATVHSIASQNDFQPILSVSENTSPILLAEAMDVDSENRRLKNEIAKLEEKLKCVLDHSIESDARLLQYTDQLFVANIPHNITASCHKSTQDIAVQCNLSDAHSSVPVDDISTSTHRAPKIGETCNEDLDLVCRLRTTIEVLEAELQCLRLELKSCSCRQKGEDCQWTVVRSKKCELQLRNKFDSLRVVGDTGVNKLTKSSGKLNEIKKGQKESKRLQRGKVNKNVITYGQNNPKKLLSFPPIVIEGDSHSRHIAGMVRDLVGPSTAVFGLCKPGAKLQNIISSTSPSAPEGQNSPLGCTILIAGANDLAAGEVHNIYRNLERHIIARKSTSRLVIATLPFRHDLPAHHSTNEEIVCTNNFIEELAFRHNIQVLNFNVIRRHYFTKHGMHLSMRGKRLLAKMIVECASKLDGLGLAIGDHLRTPTGVQQLGVNPSPATSGEPSRTTGVDDLTDHQSSNTTTATETTHSLPYELYADAVKRPAYSLKEQREYPARPVCSTQKNV